MEAWSSASPFGTKDGTLWVPKALMKDIVEDLDLQRMCSSPDYLPMLDIQDEGDLRLCENEARCALVLKERCPK